MTKKEAFEEFRESYRCESCKAVAFGSDKVALREDWNNFADTLCKTGMITVKQYESWSNPF